MQRGGGAESITPARGDAKDIEAGFFGASFLGEVGGPAAAHPAGVERRRDVTAVVGGNSSLGGSRDP